MTSKNLHSRGKLLARADVQVDFQVVCAKCHQLLIIATIIHFADCPQVSIEPCLCQAKETMRSNAKRMGLITETDVIMKEMKDDIKQVDT